jgi:hypothetical protein
MSRNPGINSPVGEDVCEFVEAREEWGHDESDVQDLIRLVGRSGCHNRLRHVHSFDEACDELTRICCSKSTWRATRRMRGMTLSPEQTPETLGAGDSECKRVALPSQ